jgi:RimJ/RimL family protein N-acetyltransferase
MDDGWAWAEPIRERHFAPPLLGRFALERVTEGEYWSRWVPMWRGHWPPEVYFDFDQLCSEDARARRERVVASEGGGRLTENWVVREGADPVALFSGRQQSGAAYLMTHAQVHPDHQGQGLYTEIVRRVIAYTGELGFERILSEHGVGNNAVLVPKLKLGFRIVAFEIEPAFGLTLRLAYFHDPEQLAAYAFRYGDATLTTPLIKSGFAGMKQLREQFRDAE